jgi:hypothetical protein
LFGSLPAPEEIDATVRSRLADSLMHIVDRAGTRLTVDETRFKNAVSQIRGGRQDPGVFARYYDLVSLLMANRLASASSMLDDLLDRATRPVQFEILPYDKQRLGPDYDRFPQLLFAEFSHVNPMDQPAAPRAVEAISAVQDAIQIISQVDPAICREIESLLVRIYLAQTSAAPNAKRFAGATSFLIWGASFANIDVYRTRWQAAQFLVHEVTHALLLGLNCDDPLIRNSPAESYNSPLRTDPRPMDGIFHATLVCARLAAFNRSWLHEGLLEGSDRAASEAAYVDNKSRFIEGLAVIDRHGKLSDQARSLVDDAGQALLVCN